MTNSKMNRIWFKIIMPGLTRRLKNQSKKLRRKNDNGEKRSLIIYDR